MEFLNLNFIKRGSDFYTNLKWTQDGKEILNLIENKFGKQNCYILSAPGFNPYDYSGKAKWVINNIPDYVYGKRFILNSNKSIEAGENRVLVDDKDSNISDFIDAGGKGILVARSWNTKYGLSGNTLENFKQELNKLDEQK